jgi:hypothetical protein
MTATHVYAHDKGFGRHHADLEGREHPAEMRDLDMAPGTEAELAGTDEASGYRIVAWADQSGTPRQTSVEPGFFAAHFTALDGSTL